MRNHKTEGIILKRRNIYEADRILTVFTKKHGKIKVKAVGVRRINSRRSPHIELLNYGILSLYTSKTMSILTEIETLENFSEIKKNLTKVGFAYHLCELVDGLCPENQENAFIFNLLRRTLLRLSCEEDIAIIIHEFEIELLTNLGYYKNNLIQKEEDTALIIENILERKLKTKQILHHFKK